MSKIKLDWLPMGSVVKLSGADVPIMVTGRLQRTKQDDKVFEYSGCSWPYGFEDSSHAVLFDGNRIEHVLFLGYRTDAELAWCEQLTEVKKASNKRERGQM